MNESRVSSLESRVGELVNLDSGLGTRDSGLEFGFTLLELLVVLLIIGIVSSFAVLSTNLAGRDQSLDEESQRLLALLRLAGQEAVLQTEELAVQFDSNRYRFLRYEQNEWKPLEDDLFRERTLPDTLHVDLQLEGRPIVLDAPDKDPDKSDMDKKDQPLTPQIVLLSSGEVSPFVLTLSKRSGDEQRVIKSVGDGSFELDPKADERSP